MPPETLRTVQGQLETSFARLAKAADELAFRYESLAGGPSVRVAEDQLELQRVEKVEIDRISPEAERSLGRSVASSLLSVLVAAPGLLANAAIGPFRGVTNVVPGVLPTLGFRAGAVYAPDQFARLRDALYSDEDLGISARDAYLLQRNLANIPQTVAYGLLGAYALRGLGTGARGARLGASALGALGGAGSAISRGALRGAGALLGRGLGLLGPAGLAVGTTFLAGDIGLEVYNAAIDPNRTFFDSDRGQGTIRDTGIARLLGFGPDEDQTVTPSLRERALAQLTFTEDDEATLQAFLRRANRSDRGRTIATTIIQGRRQRERADFLETLPEGSRVFDPFAQLDIEREEQIGLTRRSGEGIEAAGEAAREQLTLLDRLAVDARVAEDRIIGLANASRDFGQAFSDTIKTGIMDSGNFVEALAGLSSRLQDILLQVSVFGPLERIATDFFSRTFGDSGLGAAAQARAYGGPVMAGESYIVGERGVEVFTPSMSGHITPNHELSSGMGRGDAPITVNMEINDADPARARAYMDASLSRAHEERIRGRLHASSDDYRGRG